MLNIYSPLCFLSQPNKTHKKFRYVALALLALSNTAISSSANAMLLDDVPKTMAVKPQGPVSAPVTLADLVESPAALLHPWRVDTPEELNLTLPPLTIHTTEVSDIPDDVRDLGPIELLRRGYSRDAILSANYPAGELLEAEFAEDELRGAGYTKGERLAARCVLGLSRALENIVGDSLTAHTTEVGSIRENEYNQGGEFPETLIYSLTIPTTEDSSINDNIIEDRPLYYYNPDLSSALRGLIIMAEMTEYITRSQARALRDDLRYLAMFDRPQFLLHSMLIEEFLRNNIDTNSHRPMVVMPVDDFFENLLGQSSFINYASEDDSEEEIYGPAPAA